MQRTNLSTTGRCLVRAESGAECARLIAAVRAGGHDGPISVVVDAESAQDWSRVYQAVRYLSDVESIVIDHEQATSYGDSAEHCLYRLQQLRRVDKPIDVMGYPADAPAIVGIRYAYPAPRPSALEAGHPAPPATADDDAPPPEETQND